MFAVAVATAPRQWHWPPLHLQAHCGMGVPRFKGGGGGDSTKTAIINHGG